MEIEAENNKKIKAKPGDIVALESNHFNNWTGITEYYLVIYNNYRYYLVNIETGEIFMNTYPSLNKINDLVRMDEGHVYSGNSAKLILKGNA